MESTFLSTDLLRSTHEYVKLVEATLMSADVRQRGESTDRDLFRGMLVIVFTLYPDWSHEIAEDMSYVKMSVRRWREADSCPDPVLWPQIFNWLKEKTSC